MLTKDDVTADKLRGGFYSPEVLVNLCLSRIATLLEDRTSLRLFEPAVGDGAFLRGLDRHPLRQQVSEVTAVEVVPGEAATAREQLALLGVAGRVDTANVLEWDTRSTDEFDVVVGNPPYVRFQFLSPEDRQRALNIGLAAGVPGTAVSNLWIPVLLLSLVRLSAGGAFSVIVPMEFMTGVAAGRVREWLLANTRDLTIDMFKPGSFPAVLQEVVVLSGRKVVGRSKSSSVVRFYDHNGETRTWKHAIAEGASTWTSYLLANLQLNAWLRSAELANVRRLGSIARFSVSTVTGANSFFCVSTETAKRYGLEPWLLPLLPRIKHATGLVFDATEHAAIASSETAAWMLSFAADAPSPLKAVAANAYLADGEDRELHLRFKCRVRDPWFRVPVVSPGTLLLSKRSDVFPRVILNRAGVVTTDTVYRGVVAAGAGVTAEDVAASFHNSLTLLSVEIGGRSFGGGVLELVPSEIAALLVPVTTKARGAIPDLDRISRAAPQGEALVDATDRLLTKWLPEFDKELLDGVRSAREELTHRRIERSHGSFYGE